MERARVESCLALQEKYATEVESLAVVVEKFIVKSLFHHKKRMPSLFPLLQLFLGFVLLAQIVFFRETEEERGASSFVESCRVCEQTLANDVVGRKLLSLDLIIMRVISFRSKESGR